jgi:hypothetical protein
VVSRVVVHPDADEELQRLPPGEVVAIRHAIEKLEVAGERLPFPHQSKVKGADLRELRPRGGRSPWRALYRQVGDVLVVAAIGPEALVDPKGFQRAIREAERRLAGLEL